MELLSFPLPNVLDNATQKENNRTPHHLDMEFERAESPLTTYTKEWRSASDRTFEFWKLSRFSTRLAKTLSQYVRYFTVSSTNIILFHSISIYNKTIFSERLKLKYKIVPTLSNKWKIPYFATLSSILTSSSQKQRTVIDYSFRELQNGYLQAFPSWYSTLTWTTS